MHDLLLEILRQTAIHTGYTLVCVAVGFVVGVSLGIGLSRLPRLSRYLLPLLSILNTVPGIVFIGMLVIWIGMQPATVIIALSIYAMFPVLKNTVTGLNGVDEQYKEAARGCGMNQVQSLLQVSVSFMPMPGASGAQEIGFSTFFRNYFVNNDLYAAVMVWRFFTYYLIVIGGALLVVIDQLWYRKKKLREALEAPQKEE